MENPSAPPSSLPQIAGRILLAEDDANIRRLITIYLQTAGAIVTAVDNGRVACSAALEALYAQQPFDLILMDMQMPESDGLASTTLLRSRGYSAPILALSAHLTDRQQQLWQAAGGNDIVAKPINRTAFIQVLERYLGSKTRSPRPIATEATTVIGK